MKRLLIIILVLLGCTKQQTSRVNAFTDNESVAPPFQSGFVCVGIKDSAYYGWIQIENNVGDPVYVVLKTSPTGSVVRYKRYASVNGFERFRISFKPYSCGQGFLCISANKKGINPSSWDSLIGKYVCVEHVCDGPLDTTNKAK